MFFFGIAALTAISSVVSAQINLGFGLSDSCNKALGQLVIGPAATCLNTVGLINVLTTPSTQSWVEPFDKYLTTTCSQPACTLDTISTAISGLKDGCSGDLAAKGWSADDVASMMTSWKNYYPPTRQVMCLRDTADMSGQKLCITTTLSNQEAMLGQPLNIGTLVANLPTILHSHSINIPKNISCTACTQGAYTLARPNLPSAESVQAWDNFWVNQCGENFISGTLPTSIAQTANETTATPEPSASQGAALAIRVPPFGALFASLALTVVAFVATLRG
ncbi:hypothetical protein BDV93DRAFT_611287 [Ceratobasidium sp. AG-I]|nr:hypothetical protein BDV93DRAFT_611287 [Ceratobasidium sp. AG-I]